MQSGNRPNIDFPAVIAACVHDMKNSLCMLIQSLDTLAMKIAPENQEHANDLAALHYEASRLNGDLLQLLALYRADQSQLPLDIEEHFVEDLLEEFLARNDLYMSTRKIKVEVEVDPDLSWYLDGDLIGSLLNDVMINAMRYTTDTIWVSAKVVDRMLEIRIRDNGQGYPQRMLELQAPMQKYDGKSGRTGLGLFFSNLIAQAHSNGGRKGSIQLANDSDLGGSIFTLRLP